MPNILSNYVTFPCVGMVKSQLYVFHPIDLRFLKRLNFSYLIIVFKSNLGPGCQHTAFWLCQQGRGKQTDEHKGKCLSPYHQVFPQLVLGNCHAPCCFRHPNQMISLNLGINSYDSCSAVCCDASLWLAILQATAREAFFI